MSSSHPHSLLRVQVATFNFNLQGGQELFPDLQPWLIPTISETRNEYNASSLSSGREAPDIYAVGFQELLPLHEGFLGSTLAEEVRGHTIREIKRAIRPHAGLTRPDGMYPPGGGPEDYTLIGEAHLVGISLFVFGRDRSGVPARVKEVRTSTASAGLFNLLGNKGGVGVRIVLGSSVKSSMDNLTSQDTNEVLTFVCAHLAAHDHNSPRRNQDFKTIVQRLAFPPGSTQPLPVVSDPNILPPDLQKGGHDTSKLQEKYEASRATQSEKQRLAKRGVEAALDGQTYGLYDSHHIFFFGDLNYRISLDETISSSSSSSSSSGEKEKEKEGQLTRQDVVKKLTSKDFSSLALHDQLAIHRQAGNAFHGMTEVPLARAGFGPTYKFKPVRGDNNKGKQSKQEDKKAKGDELSAKRIPGWTDRILWASVGDKGHAGLQGVDVELYRSIMSYTISDHKPLTLLATLPPLTSSRHPLLTSQTPYALAAHWQSLHVLGRTLDRLVGLLWSSLVFIGAGQLLLGIAQIALLVGLAAWYLSSSSYGRQSGDLAYWLGSLTARP